MTERVRRIRVRRSSDDVVVPATDMASMRELLKSIAFIDREAERMRTEREEKLKSLHRLMKVFRQDHLEVEEAVADIFIPKGRTVSRIDPAQFAELVDEDDFYASIEVIKARAEKVLSGKELEDITETTPGRSKPEEETVKVTRR